ncbi:MAG: bifunctional acetate--CoA ligase family protein/GNAT family N-acetyltransferase [Thermodesulfobacteriota bacterium]
MSLRNLDYLFRPECVAVIGASNRPQSIGAVIIRNLLQGGFAGPIMPVNPKYGAVAGVLAYPDVQRLPTPPQLAVICTPPATVPELVEELGKRGTRAAVVVTAGLGRAYDSRGRRLQDAMLEAARRHEVRILGPNCLGLLVPRLGLNASFSHVAALPGKIGFISQSGALATTVLDWARSKGIGFSHFVSLGDAVDLDFGDVLDYLAQDQVTRAILMYIESVHHHRDFLSAARACARIKPVLVIKAGRQTEGARAAACHTNALAGSDAVFDAAIGRAGMLRVYNFNELFAAVETLAHAAPVKAKALAIITNGGGPGVVAVDSLIEQRGSLTELGPETLAKLEQVLPATWSGANPVDIIGDAPGSRYAAALKILLEAPETEAILVMHAPTAIANSREAAQAVIDTVQAYKGYRQKLILTNWLGEEGAQPSRQLFAEAGLPSYRTPEGAVRAFIHLWRYRQNQELLLETPPSAPAECISGAKAARQVVDQVLASGHALLGEPEARTVLAAYGIPFVEARMATTPELAGELASQLGFPVALKILSPDISHKSDAQGVVLDLPEKAAVQAAAEEMLARVTALKPEARILGFTVQRMARWPRAHELIIGMACDPVFGPVLVFGHGGTAVEVVCDKAVALPPLNLSLARELISRTRVYQLLKGYRDQPAADLDAIALTLMQVSQLVIDIPQIEAIDINPLLAGPNGVLAVDARIQVRREVLPGTERLAIKPYPKELEEETVSRNGRSLRLRPLRPEDAEAHDLLISMLDPQDAYFRFFRTIGRMPRSELARLTQIDYHREMVFIAEAADPKGLPETLGEVRAMIDPDNTAAEFSILVRSDQQGQGLGRILMNKILRYCQSRGTREMVGDILFHNHRMLALAKSLGFRETLCLRDHTVQVRLPLQELPQAHALEKATEPRLAEAVS